MRSFVMYFALPFHYGRFAPALQAPPPLRKTFHNDRAQNKRQRSDASPPRECLLALPCKPVHSVYAPPVPPPWLAWAACLMRGFSSPRSGGARPAFRGHWPLWRCETHPPGAAFRWISCAVFNPVRRLLRAWLDALASAFRRLRAWLSCPLRCLSA